MKITGALILGLSLVQPVLAKSNVPTVVEWHGIKKPGDQLPDFIGVAIPSSLKNLVFANGDFRYRKLVDELNSKAQLRRNEGVASPLPPSNWDEAKVHHHPTCDITDEQTNARLYESYKSDVISQYLESNQNTTVIVSPGTWVSIGIPGFILWVYWGEDGHGENGAAGSTLNVPLSYLGRAIKERAQCAKYKWGNGRENDGFVGWPFCVYEESGIPLEMCGEKRQIAGTEVAVIPPGSFDGSWEGTLWKRGILDDEKIATGIWRP